VKASTKPKLQPGDGPRCDLGDPDLRRLDSLRDTPVEHFEAVFAAIDPKARIPQDVRNRLAERVIGAAGVHGLRSLMEATTLPPAQVLKWLQDVATTTERLLGLLGIQDAASIAKGWPHDEFMAPGGVVKVPRALPSQFGLLMPPMQVVAVERRGADATMHALPRIITLSMMLSDLIETVGRKARQLISNAPKGHGGKRRKGPGVVADLIHELFNIYADIRE
jgi:hypothetical protein